MEGWNDEAIRVLQEDFPSQRKPFKVPMAGGTYMIKESQIKIKRIKTSVQQLWTEQWRKCYVKKQEKMEIWRRKA